MTAAAMNAKTALSKAHITSFATKEGQVLIWKRRERE